MNPSHPHGPASDDGPLDPRVREATPGWVLVVSLLLAWGAALSTAVIFVRVGTAVDTLAGNADMPAGALVLMVALCLLAAAFTGAGAWFSGWAAASTEARLRQLIVSRAFAQGISTSGRSGRLLALATASVERAAQYRAAFLGPISASLSTPVLVLLVMALAVDPVTAGILLVLLVLVPLIIGGFRRLVRPIGAEYRRTQGQLTAAFLEAIQALETLVLARAADRTGAQLAERGEEHRRGLMRMLAGNQLLILVVDLAFSLTVVTAAAILAATRVHSGAITVGDAVAIMLMTVLVIGPVDVVGQFFYIGIAGRAVERQISNHVTATTMPAGRAAVEVPDAAIAFSEVTAGWPGAAPVLHNLSLRVDVGERVALVGPSGVGKSTVAAVVQSHLTPRSGEVFVRDRLAVVEQRTFLFHGTIADNLRIAAPGASEQQLWDALDVAGLTAEVEAMPADLQTPVGERGALLSGGQAQRLAIARAALSDAPILLLDEPTSQVDLAGEATILTALDRLAEGRTVLMIAHRPGAILAADRVIELVPTQVDA